MDIQDLISRYPALLKKYWLPLVLAFCGLAFFIYGLISLIGVSSENKQVSFEQQVSNSVSQSPLQMTIDVEGAVDNPGVYKLTFGSIINDAINSSGGLADDADAQYISKNINLAEKLSDGAKIYIPKVGEGGQAAQSQTSFGASAQQTGLTNINTASSDALDSLPGVGPVTAAKIINNRPYQTVNDLLSKKVVSNKVFEEIKDKVTVY